MPPYVYCGASADDSLTIIDVANPAAPVTVGNIAGAGAPNFLDGPTAVDLSGNNVFITARNDNALTIVNVANPAAPAFVGSVQDAVSLFQAWGVKVIRDLAYVVNQGPIPDGGLTIVDISNLAAPAIIGRLAMPGGQRLNVQIDDANKIAYVGGNDDGLYVVNVSDPTNPTLITQFNPGGVVIFDLYFSGQYIYGTPYLIGDALFIIEVSDPTNPALVGSVSGVGAPNYLNDATGVQVRNAIAYVCSRIDNALTIWDCSTPTTPVQIGFLVDAVNLASARYCKVVGNRAYITGWGRFTVVDITNLAAPAVLGSYSGAGAPNWLGGNGPMALIREPGVRTDPATEIT